MHLFDFRRLKAQDRSVQPFLVGAALRGRPAVRSQRPTGDHIGSPLQQSDTPPDFGPHVATCATRIKNRHYEELFISVGKDYFQVLADYEQVVPSDLRVRVSTGTRSRRQAELYDWLHGSPPVSTRTAVTRNGKTRIRGIEIALTPEQVMDAAQRALAEGRDGSTCFQSWYVCVDERRVAPKWLVSRLTGLPVSNFVSDEARRVLMQLGIKVVRV